jgi:hypothetical protein
MSYDLTCAGAIKREMDAIANGVLKLKRTGPLPNPKGKSLADFKKMIDESDVAKYTGIFFSLVENMKRDRDGNATIDTKRCKYVLKKFDEMRNRAHKEKKEELPKLLAEKDKRRKLDQENDGKFVVVRTKFGKGGSFATLVPEHLASTHLA